MTPRSTAIDAYLDAIERFDIGSIRDDLHPDVTVALHPNAFAPHGSSSGLEEVVAALAAGRELLIRQSFSDRTYIELMDGSVLATMTWTGETARDMPGVAAGTILKADIASLLTFDGERVLRQENWNCYYPPQPPSAP